METLLKHGKYDVKDVVATKKKVPNLRVFLNEMKQEMRRQYEEVMLVDDELRNGRPLGGEQPIRNVKNIVHERSFG